MRLALVVHRFGTDIAGGSEAHCRSIAERLSSAHDVTVLTTTAKDHVTWKNEYPAGVSQHGRISVRRFPVERPRSLHRFAEASEIAFDDGASEADQEAWFRENGPRTPALLEYLRTHGREFDRVLFWSFRYYQTFFGLPLVADRAVLVPTAEDDEVVRFSVLGRFFSLPAGYLFLTAEEERLVAAHASRPLPPSCVIGSGLEPPPARAPGADGLAAVGVTTPFVLYLGRVDPNKGCETLVSHFLRFREASGPPVSLVMAGPINMPLPDHPSITRTGFVDEGRREVLLSHASVLVVPSRYESLSIALLEGWNHELPALVNGRCDVLRGQAQRSDGALYYRSYAEFAHALRLLLTDGDTARRLGCQGRAYIDAEYRWPTVIQKLEGFLDVLSQNPPADA
jgi:glycosyltransferase involved in cell wall biosynthesis